MQLNQRGVTGHILRIGVLPKWYRLRQLLLAKLGGGHIKLGFAGPKIIPTPVRRSKAPQTAQNASLPTF